jgi:hypothetical protein
MDDAFYVLFEKDKDVVELTPKYLSRLCYDLKSWCGILGVAAGAVDHAIIVIRTPDALRNINVETRAAVFTKRPHDNFKFPPETA